MDVRRFQPSVIAQVIENEAVLINVSTGSYYSLRDVGATIWEELSAGRSVSEIEAVLLERYQVSREEARRDLEELLASLLAEGLISETTGASSSPPP